MITLKVPDMTCGHCKASIEKAIHGLDQSVSISFDLTTHIVRLGAAKVPTEAIMSALKEAGYEATPV
ncbi:MAG: heavy-metal-associated domain-containing protein [Pseudorhodobacter sp.]|nr:heavy-metal-associated domain-containing protein [Pseudorhodobacter sp.]